MEELARDFPDVRVLTDNFTVLGQAIAVPKGHRARLDGVNRFIADALRSDVVKTSIERSQLLGVEQAPVGGATGR
jgi:hypothetical protein